jgi:hypothetical protein
MTPPNQHLGIIFFTGLQQPLPSVLFLDARYHEDDTRLDVASTKVVQSVVAGRVKIPTRPSTQLDSQKEKFPAAPWLIPGNEGNMQNGCTTRV